MATTTQRVTFVSTYYQLAGLPAGSIAVDHSSGNAYRVVQCPARGVVVYRLHPDGTTTVVPMPAASGNGGSFGRALAVVYLAGA